MKKHALYILVTFLILTFIGGTAFVSENNNSKPEGVKVEWMTFEEAIEKSKKEKRKIFIDVYTDWCGWCKVMDRQTFSQADIAKYLNEKFYPVKLNAEQREDIEFRGATFKYIASGRRGYHQLAAALLQNKLSYPTVVFLDEDFNMIQPLPGFKKPKDFDPIMKFIGGNYFKDTSFQDFQKVYKSPF